MRFFAAAALLLLLTGCTSTPEPDEGAYLEGVRALYDDGHLVDDSKLLEFGYGICDGARENDISVAEMVDQVLALSNEDGLTLTTATGVSAGSYLCPDLAG